MISIIEGLLMVDYQARPFKGTQHIFETIVILESRRRHCIIVRKETLYMSMIMLSLKTL